MQKRFPETFSSGNPLTLADLRQGRDPALEHRARAALVGNLTVAQLVAGWMTHHVANLKPRTREDYARLFAQHINPAVGKQCPPSLTLRARSYSIQVRAACTAGAQDRRP